MLRPQIDTSENRRKTNFYRTVPFLPRKTVGKPSENRRFSFHRLSMKKKPIPVGKPISVLQLYCKPLQNGTNWKTEQNNFKYPHPLREQGSISLERSSTPTCLHYHHWPIYKLFRQALKARRTGGSGNRRQFFFFKSYICDADIQLVNLVFAHE